MTILLNAGVRFDGAKVVVIDDSKVVRTAVKIILEKHGCQVATTVNDFDPLLTVIEYQPDIILIGNPSPDQVMDHLDGYQTCASIKNDPALKKIPVVIIAGEDELIERERTRVVGANYFMAKPFTGDELLDAVKACISDTKAS